MTARQRWLGGTACSRALGSGLSSVWLVGQTGRLGASLSREWIDYEGGNLGEGNLDSVGLDLTHALAKATLLRADTAWSSETPDLDTHSWREFLVGLTVSRELPPGFVARGDHLVLGRWLSIFQQEDEPVQGGRGRVEGGRVEELPREGNP